MNQAILFNDDFCFCNNKKVWSFTGLLSGELVRIYIKGVDEKTIITQSQKFDWEMMVEEWLEDHEPDNQIISLD